MGITITTEDILKVRELLEKNHPRGIDPRLLEKMVNTEKVKDLTGQLKCSRCTSDITQLDEYYLVQTVFICSKCFKIIR